MVRMRALAGIATVIAIAGTCGILAWQLSIEKARSREQVQLLHAKENRIVEIERARARLETEVKRLSRKAEAATASKDSPPNTAATQPSATQEPEQFRLRRNLPGARAYFRAQQKLQFSRWYGALIQELRLSAKDGDRFLDLLVAQQERDNDASEQNRSADRASVEQARLDMKREHEAEIEALLGAEGSRTYGEYLRTLGSRMRVSQLGEQLGARGVPLSVEQRQILIALMAEEWERVPAPDHPSDGGTLDDLKKTLNWLDDYERRVRERAATTLSSQQVKFLGDQQALQAATRHSALEMQRQARLAGLSTGVGFWYPAD